MECFERVGCLGRVGMMANASCTAAIAGANASDFKWSLAFITKVMSAQLILPRSRRNAAAPRKYHPREVKGSIDKYCPDRSQSGRSIQFTSPSSKDVRARMESKQEKIGKGLAEYFQQFARQRTMSSCHVKSWAF